MKRYRFTGSKNPTATVIKIDPTQNRLSPSYVPSTDNSFKGHATPLPKIPLTSSTSKVSLNAVTPETPTPFHLPQIPSTGFNIGGNNNDNNNNKTTPTKTTARVGSADIARVKFQQRPPSSLLTLAPQSTSPASVVFGDRGKDGDELELATTETVMDQPVSSPSIFIDSQEVNGLLNGTGLNPRDQMMIYVERVKSHWNAHRKQGQVSESTNTSKRRASTSSRNETTSVSYSTNAKIESHVKVHERKTTSILTTKGDFSHNALNHSLEFMTESPELEVTTGNGINSGVVSKVHAHISHCPKLYGPVEIICDVNIRERHGNPNPFLTVGWIRKFYNETTPDKLVAVNKTLAYEEEFHDKFNVTLAPGTSPMLRSVLIIREVTVPDCGNYECEVFDGVSTHKSETLVFLCH
ncbi:unnamed protein product [Allacma fusca]|uniref:Ig-like domain-containing protein n=1 Tax=Allacma fusca TaxID=39272 RepID=A0A8J2P3P8_9HEXA|nr:unnamed protein product [Allacma fusca]